MKVLLIENHSHKIIGELILQSQPRSGEWVEYDSHMYSIHRVIHTENGIKIFGILAS